MTTDTFTQKLIVRQGTVTRLGNGWELGLQMVYEDAYTDQAGQQQRGYVARLSVLDTSQPKPRAETVTVFAGATIEAGGRFQVLEIEGGSQATLPGSSQDKIVIGQLP